MRYETKVILRQLGYTNYQAYLRSDVWRARRLAYFAHHQGRCWVCGSLQKIHLHHVNYCRVGGYERDADLLPLCAAHHRAVHNFTRRKKVPVERAHTEYVVWLRSRRPRKRRSAPRANS